MAERKRGTPTEPDVMEAERNAGHDRHQITLGSVNSHVHGCAIVQHSQDNPAVCCHSIELFTDIALGCCFSGDFWSVCVCGQLA